MNKKYLLCALLAVTLFSCNLLEKEPDKSGNASIYHIDQLYELMGNYKIYYEMNHIWQENIEFSDDVEVSPFYYQKTQCTKDYQLGTWDKDFIENGVTVDDCTWNGSFQSMFIFNTVLEYIDKVEQTSMERKEQVRGEALFGRAYFHFFAFVNFCAYDLKAPGIGYKDNTNPPPTGVPARETMEYTANRIREDIAAAKEALTKAGRDHFDSEKKFRITLPTVYAFEARFELYMGNYEAAKVAAEKALEGHHALVKVDGNPDYERIVTRTTPVLDKDGNDTGEVIKSYLPKLYNQPYGLYQYDEAYLPHCSTVWFANAVPMSKSLYDLFDKENDTRWLCFYNNNYVPCNHGFNSGGFDMEEQTNLNEWEKHTYIRFSYEWIYFIKFKSFLLSPTTAEMYLIRAECNARLGDNAKAREDLLTLRRSRFLTEESAEAGIEGTVEEVIDERRREFAGVLRFYDLKRLNFRENANISITRKRHQDINDFNSPIVEFTLQPQDPFYAVPMPGGEIKMMGWQQN